LQAHCINFYSGLHEKTKKNAKIKQKSLALLHSVEYNNAVPRKGKAKKPKQTIERKKAMKYTLAELKNGELLLTAEHEGETLRISATPDDMARYLNVARGSFDLSGLQDAVTLLDEVSEDEYEDMAATWAAAATIADEKGLYRSAAGESGKMALTLAELESDPLAELARCSSADEIASMVYDHAELVSPYAFASGHSARAHSKKRALEVCRLMFDKMRPATFESLRTWVWGCDLVCRDILPGGRLDLLAYNAEDGDCLFSAADFLQLTAENCDIAEELADLCERVLGATVHREFDGSHAWYDFAKNVAEK
jgi:hypothetical protein